MPTASAVNVRDIPVRLLWVHGRIPSPSIREPDARRRRPL